MAEELPSALCSGGLDTSPAPSPSTVPYTLLYRVPRDVPSTELMLIPGVPPAP